MAEHLGNTEDEDLPVESDAIEETRTPGVDGLLDMTEALTIDVDDDFGPETSRVGEPIARPLVLGDDDPRDEGLRERVLDEHAVYEGLIFSVDRVRVELPDGREARRDVVRHPGAVAIVALTDDGRICLVRQYRTALGRVTVEVPAGKLDPGEDPLDCARRELAEETGMVARNMAYLTTITSSVGYCDELIHIYMATGLHFDCPDPDADEFINVDLVDLSEFIDAVLDGRIEDSKTVVGALICDAVSHRLEPAL